MIYYVIKDRNDGTYRAERFGPDDSYIRWKLRVGNATRYIEPKVAHAVRKELQKIYASSADLVVVKVTSKERT